MALASGFTPCGPTTTHYRADHGTLCGLISGVLEMRGGKPTCSDCRRIERETATCEFCGRRLKRHKLRDLGPEGFICEPCDTDDGDDWHANDYWVRLREGLLSY